MKAVSKKTKNNRIVDLPVLIEQDENGIYVGSVPSLRSCYTQGKTLNELYKNLEEVVALCVEAEKEFFGQKVRTSQIIGFQNLSFSLR